MRQITVTVRSRLLNAAVLRLPATVIAPDYVITLSAAPIAPAPAGAVITAPLIPSSAFVLAPMLSPGAVSIAVPTIASGAQVPAPAIMPGGVAIAPPTIAGTAAVPQPTVSAAGSGAPALISPPLISSAAAVPAPAVTVGPVTIQSPLIASGSVVPIAAVTPGALIIAPPSIASASGVPAPTLSPGAVSIAAPTIASSAAVPAPNLVPGPVTVAPAAIASTAAVRAPVVTQAASEDSATTAYAAAMTVAPSTARRALINDLIVGLKADGDWAGLDRLALLAAHDAQAARVDARNPAKSLSAVNAPIFTADRGYAGDGATSYLDLGETFSAAGNQFAQDNAAIGAWCNNAGGTGSTRHMGLIGGTLLAFIEARNDGIEVFRLNDTTSSQTARSSASRLGHRTQVRAAGGLKRVFYNGVRSAEVAVASVGLSTSNGVALRGAGIYSPDRLAALYSGAGLSDAAVARIHNRLSTYLTAIGAN